MFSPFFLGQQACIMGSMLQQQPWRTPNASRYPTMVALSPLKLFTIVLSSNSIFIRVVAAITTRSPPSSSSNSRRVTQSHLMGACVLSVLAPNGNQCKGLVLTRPQINFNNRFSRVNNIKITSALWHRVPWITCIIHLLKRRMCPLRTSSGARFQQRTSRPSSKRVATSWCRALQ